MRPIYQPVVCNVLILSSVSRLTTTIIISGSTQLVPTIVSGEMETYRTVTLTVTDQLLPTSVPGGKEVCQREEIGSSAVISVSTVSLLLIVTLTTIILTQCLLMIKMKRSIHRNETYTEVMASTTVHKDVPVSPNEAYAVTKMTSAGEEVTYELVK